MRNFIKENFKEVVRGV